MIGGGQWGAEPPRCGVSASEPPRGERRSREGASSPLVSDEPRRQLASRSTASAWGDVSVVEKVVGYKKVKFQTHENTGYGDVHLPAMQMHTTSFWLRLGDDTRHVAPPAQRIDGLRGLGIALETVATFRLMCDPRDLGMALDDGREEIDGCPTLFLYEHVPGGTGLTERVFSLREELFAQAHKLVTTCACAAGCPACVGPGESGERKRVAAELLRLLSSGS